MNVGLRTHSPALAQLPQRALISTHFLSLSGFCTGSASHFLQESGQVPCMYDGFLSHSPAFAHAVHSNLVSAQGRIPTAGSRWTALAGAVDATAGSCWTVLPAADAAASATAGCTAGAFVGALTGDCTTVSSGWSTALPCARPAPLATSSRAETATQSRITGH